MIILCDFDGVIGDLHTTWLRRYNDDFNDNLTCEDITGWGMVDYIKPECGNNIFNYLRSPDLYDEVEPIEGAVETLQLFRELGHEVIILTSCVGTEMIEGKVEWLFKYGLLPEPRHRGMKSLMVCSRKELVQGDVFIDDRADTIKKSRLVKWPILFDQPWNRHEQGLPRVFNWEDVADFVEGVARHE